MCMRVCQGASVMSDCESMDCSPLGSSVPGILHALLQGILPSQVSCISGIGRRVLYH